MSLNYLLLNNILTKIDQSYNFNFPVYFSNDVGNRYNSYLESKYNYLVQMYSIHFMHIAFYESLISNYSINLDINSFSHFFVKYQSQSSTKYKKFIQVLRNNMDEIMSMDILTNSFNNVSIKSVEVEVDIDEIICNNFSELSIEY